MRLFIVLMVLNVVFACWTAHHSKVTSLTVVTLTLTEFKMIVIFDFVVQSERSWKTSEEFKNIESRDERYDNW